MAKMLYGQINTDQTLFVNNLTQNSQMQMQVFIENNYFF